MGQKTTVNAEPGKHDVVITRDFDLPLELLFKAYEDPGLVAQWMGTNVIKQENKNHGSYEYRTSDPNGNVVFTANGVIHEFRRNNKIVRTFEMSNAPFGVQLEVYNFAQTSAVTSRLNMHVIYESVEQRDQVLKLPFAQGLAMAHDRIQQIAGALL